MKMWLTDRLEAALPNLYGDAADSKVLYLA